MGNLLNIGNSKGIKFELDKEVFTGDYWVDGKPIYRIVKQINSLNSPNVNIALGFTFEEIVSIKSIFKGIDKNMGSLPYYSTDYMPTTTDYARTSITGEKLYVRTGEQFIDFEKVTCIIRYTKSGGVTKTLNRIKSCLSGLKVGVIYA